MELHKEKRVFAGSSQMKELHAQNWVLAYLGCTIYMLLDDLWVGVTRGL